MKLETKRAKPFCAALANFPVAAAGTTRSEIAPNGGGFDELTILQKLDQHLRRPPRAAILADIVRWQAAEFAPSLQASLW